MSKSPVGVLSAAELRVRAVSRLEGPVDPQAAHRGAAAAFRVLHDMAWSPDTAVDALALLHELQVHQVELELQAEEMRGIRDELEASAAWHARLHDASPAGCLTVDRDGTVREANLTACTLLGEDRDALPGRRLPDFLDAPSARVLRERVDAAATGRGFAARTLQGTRRDGTAFRVHADVGVHPDGLGFLVVLLAADADVDDAAAPARVTSP